MNPCRLRRGFTLIELLVVIAIIAILASMLLPSLTKAKQKGQGIQCMNNHKQIALAWRMYTDEFNGFLLMATPSGMGDPVIGKVSWMSGILDFDNGNSSNWDVERDIKKSPLWPYMGKSPGILKCPADKSVVRPTSGPFRNQVVPRVRSMSMNFWFGAFGGELLSLPTGGKAWRIYFNERDIIDPGPTRTFLFLDVREDSIDTGNFATDMRGWPDQPARTGFFDLPASYHHFAGGFSFVDGHSEIKRWRDGRTSPRVKKGGDIDVGGYTASPNNRDVVWLQERCTREK